MKKLILILTLSLLANNAFADCVDVKGAEAIVKCTDGNVVCYSYTIQSNGITSTALSCIKK